MAKIENVEINIKVGKREYTIKNLILNELLNVYAKALITDYKTQRKYLKHCFVKFNTPLTFNENSKLKNTDFDIAILNDTTEVELSPNQITKKYNWSNSLYDFSTTRVWNDYKGKKICTIGFGFNFMKSSTYNMCAVVDVSNYNIYVEENEEICITRIDRITTDTVFTTSNKEKVKGPVHLHGGITGILPSQTFTSPDGTEKRFVEGVAYAKLTNIGLSDFTNKIEKELQLNNNYEVNNNVFKIKNIYSPPGLYPNGDLFPSDDLFPEEKSYKYLILKFKLYQDVDKGTFSTPNVVVTDTGEYYLQAIELDKYNNVELDIKYERG